MGSKVRFVEGTPCKWCNEGKLHEVTESNPAPMPSNYDIGYALKIGLNHGKKAKYIKDLGAAEWNNIFVETHTALPIAVPC